MAHSHFKNVSNVADNTYGTKKTANACKRFENEELQGLNVI